MARRPRDEEPPSEPDGAEPEVAETGERLDAGVEHLQTAAHELVAAARSFLDVVEDVVSDREKLGAVSASITELLGGAGSGLARLAERFAAGAGGAEPDDGPSGDHSGPPTERPRLRRIEIE